MNATIKTTTQWIILVLSLFSLVNSANAQSYNLNTEDYVQSLRKKYASYQGFNVDFKIDMSFPDGQSQELNGSYWSKGKKSLIDMTDQAIYCDGSALWSFDKTDNYVEINDVEEGGFTVSPQAIFDMLGSTQYTFALSFSGLEHGNKVDKIEFKPNDEYSDFSKARLTVNSANKDLMSLETFYKDGSRMVLNIVQLKEEVKADSFFEFNPIDHGNPEIEDLRL